MRRRTIKRDALNRGTAVHLGGARVRFIWPCGCKHVETVKDIPGKRGRPLSDTSAAILVRNWRTNGVVLRQCPKHPDWYSRESQLARLNIENPQP